ncbi:MAG: hypothetical protein OQK32_03425, partial [Gammaproteobacteria bacterium]|nr:hypothetical protein [Gammaproteobacteria bacterium]
RRGLLKAHARATGPRTAEGKAISAANLDGHPTPEEAQKTRFNAITHGLTSKVANFYPAKPGRYERCNGCDYYGSECIEDPPANHSNPVSCLSRVELFMQHRMAFESGDAGMLAMLRSDTQAGLQAIINDIILDIAQRGVTLVAPEWKINPQTGGVVIADYTDRESGQRHTIHEVKAHPLLKILIDFIAKNNLSLEDMNMTPKVQEENDIMKGFVDETGENAESTREYQQRMIDQNNALMDLIGKSYGNKETVIDAEVIERG